MVKAVCRQQTSVERGSLSQLLRFCMPQCLSPSFTPYVFVCVCVCVCVRESVTLSSADLDDTH